MEARPFLLAGMCSRSQTPALRPLLSRVRTLSRRRSRRSRRSLIRSQTQSPTMMTMTTKTTITTGTMMTTMTTMNGSMASATGSMTMIEGQTQALICAQNAALREEIMREIADLPQADLRGVLRMIAVWKGRGND